jgi:GNAT superfamily N-acetyltransferase
LLTIRVGTEQDRLAIADVHVRSWQAAYQGLFPDEYLDSLRPEHRASHYVFESGDPSHHTTLVAMDGACVMGFATFGLSHDPSLPGCGEISSLYAAPEAWGHGVGRRLIAEARSRLAEQSFAEAFLWVLNGNSRACRFYEIDGWITDGERREDEVWGVAAEEVRYWHRLR